MVVFDMDIAEIPEGSPSRVEFEVSFRGAVVETAGRKGVTVLDRDVRITSIRGGSVVVTEALGAEGRVFELSYFVAMEFLGSERHCRL